jgi:HK97 family phage major capsid protein
VACSPPHPDQGDRTVDKIKQLLDELAQVVAEMEAMSEAPAEGDAPAMDAEEESSLRSLSERADKLRSQIELLRAIEAKNLELRAVLERGAPAKAIEKAAAEEAPVEKRTVPAIPVSHGPLKAFRSAESAYRAGMHLRGYVFGDAEARRWCVDHGVESRAQAGGVNSLGGVLTSPELSSEIIRLVEEFGVYPQFARRVPMNSDTLNIARRTGGLAARPVGENAEVLASDVTFDNVELVAKIWGVANRVPNSLLEDSVIDLADLMAVEIAQAFAEAVDNAGFVGDGTSTYHGVEGITKKIVKAAHSASVVSTTDSTEDQYSELTMKNFTDLVAKLPIYARRSARFFISPAGWGSAMLRLAMLPGGASGPGGNSSSDVAAGFGERFLGYPVTLVHSMHSSLTDSSGEVACLFGDLSQAAVYGERRAIQIRTASERYIEYDQTLTFATTRNAMVVHDVGSTTKAGPVVALKFG